MAEHDFIIDNGTGSAVRTDINNVLQAIASNNSKSGALTTNYAFQWHVDTSDGLLKIRNAANNGYVTVGTAASTNLGLVNAATPTMTGDVTMSSTGFLKVPVGNNAQQPGQSGAPAAAAGQFRYNSDTGQFEGYTTSWGAIGGGAGATGGGNDQVFFESDQTATQSYTLSSGKHAHTVSPTINSGVTITVPSGAILVIL